MDQQPNTAASAQPGPLQDPYGTHYAAFADDIYAAVRRAAYGDDFGQAGWQTAQEHARMLRWLDLDPAAQVLDLGCGAGGPAIRLAQLVGCQVVGVDIEASAIATATATAEQHGLADRVRFTQHDASTPLPFPDATFTAVLCIDAVGHFGYRPAVVAEWRRVLEPGGRLVMTDPMVVTGPLAGEEMAVRAALGLTLFVPPGYNEQVLREGGFTVEVVEDRTDDIATIATRGLAARVAHEVALRDLEGDDAYAAQQVFFGICAQLARERRLSRFAYVARKPAG